MRPSASNRITLLIKSNKPFLIFALRSFGFARGKIAFHLPLGGEFRFQRVNAAGVGIQKFAVDGSAVVAENFRQHGVGDERPGKTVAVERDAAARQIRPPPPESPGRNIPGCLRPHGRECSRCGKSRGRGQCERRRNNSSSARIGASTTRSRLPSCAASCKSGKPQFWPLAANASGGAPAWVSM